MEGDMDPAIIARIEAVSKDGSIRCEQALAIARELGVPARDVGDVLDRTGVRIISCQLGCFP